MIARGGAEERVLRIVSLLFSVAALVFGLLSLGAILGQLGSAPPWWTAAALVAILGTSAALGSVAALAPVGVIRGLAAAVAIGYLAVALTMPFVFAPVATSGSAPWPLGLTALGTTAAALAFPAAISWAATLLLGVLVAVDRIATARGDLVAIALQDAAYATFFAAVFVALTLGALAAAKRIDRTAADADRTAAAAAVDRAHQDERTRVDALVHDRVLAVLLLAGRGMTGAEADVREQAAAALTGLKLLADGDAEEHDLPPAQLVDRLRNQVTMLAPWAQLTVEDDLAERPLPARVADALLGASGEALRNAIRHSGAGVAVAVHVHLEHGGVTVTVLDDGLGFEPRAVPEGRLGVASSIVGRMRSVRGSAEVRSRPGRGTAVRLDWRRP